jgi:hypothetical protein
MRTPEMMPVKPIAWSCGVFESEQAAVSPGTGCPGGQDPEHSQAVCRCGRRAQAAPEKDTETSRQTDDAADQVDPTPGTGARRDQGVRTVDIREDPPHDDRAIAATAVSL